jgi:hypothetical protein
MTKPEKIEEEDNANKGGDDDKNSIDEEGGDGAWPLDDFLHKEYDELVHIFEFGKLTTWYWIGIGVLAGTLASGYPILITIARTGTDAVEEPALLLVLFEAGQVTGVPIALYLLGYLDMFNMQLPDVRIESFQSVFETLWRLPVQDKIVSFLIGMAIGSAFAMYFYGSSGPVPYAISFLLMSLMLPFAVCTSIVIGEYSNIPLLSWVYGFIFIGLVFYAVGMYVLVAYAYESSR